MIPRVYVTETKVALIQRSCGYALRPTLDMAEIDMAVQVIKRQSPSCIVAVDNCYGEFTSTKEPCAVSTLMLRPSWRSQQPEHAATVAC